MEALELRNDLIPNVTTYTYLYLHFYLYLSFQVGKPNLRKTLLVSVGQAYQMPN